MNDEHPDAARYDEVWQLFLPFIVYRSSFIVLFRPSSFSSAMSASHMSTPWVDGLTIPQVLEQTVKRFRDRDALVFPQLELRWNYERFAVEVDRAARGLAALGVETGQHVAVWATNVPQWVVLQFATAKIGAVLV